MALDWCVGRLTEIMVAEKIVIRFAFLGIVILAGIIIVAFFLGSISKPSLTDQLNQGSTLASTIDTCDHVDV